MRHSRNVFRRPGFWLLLATVSVAPGGAARPETAEAEPAQPLRSALRSPILFVKRHSYLGIHIYDTYYKWRPGGGICILENPSDPPEEHRVRPLVGAGGAVTLGDGVYSDPELSYDARRLLFCYKGEANGHTSIYEIGIDGSGLRRLTQPECCECSEGRFRSQHDVGPAYLPDGRIIFTSTRLNGLVPCNNTGVDVLHVMNSDGSSPRAISVNNVNEFDPCVMPDGRILHGRWEYVDKTALTQQSLWTIHPDGSHETALFANNMVHPEALLDARPVPGSPHLVAATFCPHNSPPRGTMAIVDPRLDKDGAHAIVNFERPDAPTHDRGNSCEPWPLSRDLILFSGRPAGQQRNVIELVHRSGRREIVHADPDICCHAPMPIEPRPVPPRKPTVVQRDARKGRFYVQDIYRGLDGVRRGEVRWLRVLEETSRVTGSPGGAYNQTFLLSAALAFSVKNFLGVVPVEPDGSAYFEAEAGRAIYLQALDADGRLVRSMRTFVQAAPGVTRSCIGCHESKQTAPSSRTRMGLALRRAPSRPRPETWGSGYLDYPGMVQPVLDRHCVPCHGGEKGIASGLDLSGGWTEHFNISYEALVSRGTTQVTARLISGIDCMNGTAFWSASILPPRGHGSGNAPLADLLVSGHDNRIPDLSRRERDLLLAWIDTNGLYHGTWDWSTHGCSVKSWGSVRRALESEMRTAGCLRCHGNGQRASLFENDWFNLRRPEMSRILRAPLPEGAEGWGLGLCREAKVDPARQRIRLLKNGQYLHAVAPLETFRLPARPEPPSGATVTPFASRQDPVYQRMLAIIRDGRRTALAEPRVDMPGAEVKEGACRHLLPVPLPSPLPEVTARLDVEGRVRLGWERSSRTIGLSAEIHRGPADGFVPGLETIVGETRRFEWIDASAPEGEVGYSVVWRSGDQRSEPATVRIRVTAPPPPPPPRDVVARGEPGRVALRWADGDPERQLRYHLDRTPAGGDVPTRLTRTPTPHATFRDATAIPGTTYSYVVRAVSRRGVEGDGSAAVTAAALPEIREPLFRAALDATPDGKLLDGEPLHGRIHGPARVQEGSLDLRRGGHATFPKHPAFDIEGRISVSVHVRFEPGGDMPVVVSCGRWQGPGWFLQRLGGRWRWHVGGIDCDGGTVESGRWLHVVATYDGEVARLYEDGKPVAEARGQADPSPFSGALHVGQYSAGPGPQYAVTGQIRDLKVFRRILDPTPRPAD